jgi:Putative zinc-finger
VSHLGHRLSALIDDELSHAERDRVLAHLARCDLCRQEAAALRILKQRMLALGEATAAAALTDRLMALAALPGLPGRGLAWPAGGRHDPLAGQGVRWGLRGMAVVALVLFGLGIPAAAFVAGGSQTSPGPSITPAVELFMVHHAAVPVQPPAAGPAHSSAPAPGHRPDGRETAAGTNDGPAVSPSPVWAAVSSAPATPVPAASPLPVGVITRPR